MKKKQPSDWQIIVVIFTLFPFPTPTQTQTHRHAHTVNRHNFLHGIHFKQRMKRVQLHTINLVAIYRRLRVTFH